MLTSASQAQITRRSILQNPLLAKKPMGLEQYSNHLIHKRLFYTN